MADTTHLARHDHALAEETRELHDLAQRLADHAPALAGAISRLEAALDKSIAHASHPIEAEQAAETFARRLRRVWLEAAGAEAGSVYRSPTAGQTRRLARHHDAFGYERDLQPESLEARCTKFFPQPPAGWRQDHLILSSGQAAMTCALLGLGAHLSKGAPLRIAHRGAYFETRALIKLMPFLTEATFAQTAEIVLDEPVCCDGRFHQIDTKKLLSASPRAVIFDTTLLGRKDGIDRYLAALTTTEAPIVLRVTSCLKLFEDGFELANAGILSVYTRASDANLDLGADFRRIRTLTGSGPGLADAVALEAPWFLDAHDADTYAAAIFAHNADLARAVAQTVAKSNTRFAPVTHPSLNGGAAPYCAFQLDADPKAYDALEREIIAEADKRQLLLHHGGSFGFRGHRFEVVKPETGEPPFLRVALGHRGGWSCEGIIAMMAEMARR